MYQPDIYDLILPGAFAGDVDFYRKQAQLAGGPVLELGAGTGRMAIPMARDGTIVTRSRTSGGSAASFTRSRSSMAVSTSSAYTSIPQHNSQVRPDLA